MKMNKYKEEDMKNTKWMNKTWMMNKWDKWKECTNKKNKTIWKANNLKEKAKNNNLK